MRFGEVQGDNIIDWLVPGQSGGIYPRASDHRYVERGRRRAKKSGVIWRPQRDLRILAVRRNFFHPQFMAVYHEYPFCLTLSNWKGHPGVEAMAATAHNFESSHESALIDVKGWLQCLDRFAPRQYRPQRYRKNAD